MISKDTLRKLKLVHDMVLSLPIEQEQFITRLASATEQRPSSPRYSAVEANYSFNREFTGNVGPDWFTIRRRARSFERNSLTLIKVEGAVLSAEDGCVVKLELNAFHPLFYALYGMLFIFYAFLVIQALDSKPTLLLVALLHASIFVVLPYLLMRRLLSKMKHYLEREFFFLTRQAN
ncbi:hypothetical protein D3Y59_13905 [Hymenobacter oligotrophus]|uniref:Uncharacterized protein n=1 Tax=Hymenobacter oligotrophus TaxID=2319843 RepID=A0A3B7QXZ2_9BACT|nr:hypothetical protein [Hymenobacter oligotrophus]AYA38038.1 hypothetical protein D3Y59_13905 [Hymenobacter oligotrophus]